MRPRRSKTDGGPRQDVGLLVQEDRLTDHGQPAGHSTGRSPSRGPDNGRDEKWNEAALVLDGRTYTLADLVLVAVLSDRWNRFAARVFGRDEEAPVDSEDVTNGVIAFRRARRLEAAADLRNWLSERDLDQDDLFAFVRSQLASEASIGGKARPRTERGSRPRRRMGPPGDSPREDALVAGGRDERGRRALGHHSPALVGRAEPCCANAAG